MKCRILFSGKNKKNVSKCQLKILPRMLSVKGKKHTKCSVYLKIFIFRKQASWRKLDMTIDKEVRKKNKTKNNNKKTTTTKIVACTFINGHGRC